MRQLQADALRKAFCKVVRPFRRPALSFGVAVGAVS